MYFGTDRKPVAGAQEPRERFGDERGQAVTYGFTEVSIPRGHTTGEVESPWFLRRYLETPRRHVVLMRVQLQGPDVFYGELEAHAKSRVRSPLIFVHGFNNTFEDTARRTAQIAHDIKFPGVPQFYSRPSGGAVRDYISDGNNADQAVTYLKVFLTEIAERATFESVTLIAHSMGNRALTRAIMGLRNEIQPANLRKFRELILAAPDIDADVFRNEIAPALVATKAGITLYASSADEALRASKAVNGARWAGDSEGGALVIPGIDYIDATNVDTSLFGGLRHAYVADSHNVLNDMHALIVNRLPVGKRLGLDPLPDAASPKYWRFRR